MEKGASFLVKYGRFFSKGQHTGLDFSAMHDDLDVCACHCSGLQKCD